MLTGRRDDPGAFLRQRDTSGVSEVTHTSTAETVFRHPVICHVCAFPDKNDARVRGSRRPDGSRAVRRNKTLSLRRAQSSDLFEPALTRIFDAHRQLIELRTAQKLNAGQVDSICSALQIPAS